MRPKSDPLETYVTQVREHLIDEAVIVRALDHFPNADRIQFAADYSEIYAFCFIMTNRGLTYTSQDDVGRQIAINEAIANHIFFGERPIVLLTAYQAEFSTLERSIRHFSLSGIAELTEYLAQVRSENSKLVSWLSEIDERIAKSSGPAFLRVLAEIYDRAPGLLLLMDDDFEPASRLKRIRASGNFLRTDALPWSQSAPSSAETEEWWAEKLEAARPRASVSSNLIDAAAVTQLQSLNRSSRAERPIVLISRSEVMRRILSEHSEIPQCERVYIVHPRVVGSYIVGDSTGRSGDKILEDRYWLGREIATEFGQRLHASATPLFPTLKRRVRSVLRLWAEIDDVSIARSAWGQEVIQNRASPANSVVTSIRHLLEQQDDVRTKLEQRAVDIAKSISVENANIATISIVQSDSLPSQPIDVEPRPSAQSQPEAPALVVRASAEAMPYSMQIYDTNFSNWIGKEGDTVKALRRFVKANLAPSSEYERLLGLGYLLASVGMWEVALAYFNIAIESSSSVPKHEAYYLVAIARRNASTEMSTTILMQCATDVHSANDIKRNRKEKTYWDPRYLNELGVLLALLRKNGESPEWANAWNQNPLSVWSDALGHITDDTILKAQVLNNRVYYCAMNLSDIGISVLVSELEGLLNFIRTGDQKILTDGISHTIIVAQYIASEQTREGAKKALMELERLREKGSNWPSLRRIIDAEIMEFRQLSSR